MLKIDTAMSILKKFGYSSKNSHPYLYINNHQIGINYAYIDEKYGIIDRLALFNNEIDLESFLKKLQWYKLNGKQNKVKMELNNYEISNPEVIYIRNNHVMSDNEMFNLAYYDQKERKNLKLSHYNRLLFEADNLLDYYYIKKDEIEHYVNNYFNKKLELKRYYYDLQLLINKYNHHHIDIKLDTSLETFKINADDISKLSSNLANYKKEKVKEADVYNLLKDIWQLNKEQETNNKYLEALRYSEDIDEEMRLVVTKIDFMKELLSKKTPWFKLINLKKAFTNIDNTSTYTSLYDDDFTAKYKFFIDKKYDALNKINEFRLCEYLNDFKTTNEYDIAKNIERCKQDKKVKKIEYSTDINIINDSLKDEFNTNLNDDERAALILYTSIYKDIMDMIINIPDYNNISITKLISLLNITDGFLRVYENNYTNIKKIINLDINKDIKKKVFKNINFNNKEDFIASLRDNINILSNINDKMMVKDNLRLYTATNDFDTLGNDALLNFSNSIDTYIINKKNNYRVIVANIKKGTNVLMAPYYLKIPIADAFNQAIEIIDEPNPIIIIDTKDININKDSNVIIFSHFLANLVTQKDYTYVDDFKINYKVNISKIDIEKRKTSE
jgi:hypothetical protein